MCHIKFALTGRKEGSEDRNAVGINVELGSPFLQGISCLLKRSGPDRELWHSALSHSGVLQLNTHTFSCPPKCVCVSVSCRADHTPSPRTSERTGSSGALRGPAACRHTRRRRQDALSKVVFSILKKKHNKLIITTEHEIFINGRRHTVNRTSGQQT